MTDAAMIADALHLRRYSKGFRGCCPACGGSSRSSKFSVSDAGGRLLWHCFSGCSQDAVRAELVDRGLLPRRDENLPRPRHTRDETEHAAHLVLIADAAIRANDPIITDRANMRALMKAVLVLREAKQPTPAVSLAQQCLTRRHVKEYVARGLRHEG